MKKIFLSLGTVLFLGSLGNLHAQTTTLNTSSAVQSTPPPQIHPPKHHKKKTQGIVESSAVVYGMAAYTPTPNVGVSPSPTP